MAWRKVHVNKVIWEWQIGGTKGYTWPEYKYVLIRNPNKKVIKVNNMDLFRMSQLGIVTPGLIKSYIQDNLEKLLGDN